MKHLICLYCYHIELLDEFLENCYPILEEYDMVDMHIDFCKDTVTDEAIERLKNMRVTYAVRENRGVDILPFTKTLYEKVFSSVEYSVVTKLQSKLSDDIWRYWSYVPIVGNLEVFEKMHLFVEDNIVNGIPIMLNHRVTLDSSEVERVGYVHAIKEIETLNDKFFHFDKLDGAFFAGTMFMAPVLLFKTMFNDIDYEEFSSYFEVGKPVSGYSHAMERLYGYAVENYGGKLVGIGADDEPMRLEHMHKIDYVVKGKLEM